MKSVRFLNPAEQEMLDAARYYELQAPGLGDGFLDKIDSAVQDIAENPETWPILRTKQPIGSTQGQKKGTAHYSHQPAVENMF